MIDPDHASGAADIAPPQSGRPRLDGHARADRGGQYRLAIRRILRIEALGAGHGDQAYSPALRRGGFDPLERDGDFRARGKHHALGRARAIREHIAAASDGPERCGRAR